MSKGEKTGRGKFWLGAILGTIAGTVTGIVIAPKSGEETRKDIKLAGEKAKRASRKWFKRGEKKVMRLEAETASTIEKKKAEAKAAVKKAQDKIENIKEDLSE